ncbi:MAG TPA: hypothetical protein VK816_04655 [Jatrophihabitantaceae bacterium]|jgi:hypothetical protein|nr:hypothetical protein [Jatrophihabitantaceae bacterium]
MNSQTDHQHLQQFTMTAGNVLFWLFVGLLVLWIVSFIGELVLERLKPNLMFVVAAVFVGVIFMNVFCATLTFALDPVA